MRVSRPLKFNRTDYDASRLPYRRVAVDSVGVDKDPRSADSSKWILHQLRGLPQRAPGVLSERRERVDRRTRIWWSVFYGSFNPRRRAGRREESERFQMIDWHDSHLMGVAVCILMLCVVDAFMTLVLLSGGAREENPIMASFVYTNVKAFTIVKMLLTGFGVSVMVFLARHRFMRAIRVSSLLYMAVAVYAVLIGYELWMYGQLSDRSLFP
jgi:Domain of unknown function (DUF5658)